MSGEECKGSLQKSSDAKKLSAAEIRAVEAGSALAWAYNNELKLSGGEFTLEGHLYQAQWIGSGARVVTARKAAQMGFTEGAIIRVLHGLIYGKYPQGVLYLLPTRTDVTEFSKGRFSTLIGKNACIGRYVKDTDSANVKKVGRGMLYLRGARVAQKLEGTKATSSQLKNIPVDMVVFDEKDEMSPAMVRLAMERMSHSLVRQEINLSTPTIPSYGVDRDYEMRSDMSVWMIKCERCGGETCLELEFPDCLIDTSEGVRRVCRKCKREIYPFNGRWVARKPELSKEHVGLWVSQLNSVYIDPAEILREYLEGNDLAEFYNSKMGMAYIAAENRLTQRDVYACCGYDLPAESNVRYYCAMGVDVGKQLHYVIGYPDGEEKSRILRMGRVSSFEDLHDIARRFQVKVAVIDALPETRKVREFQAAEEYKVYMCYYQDSLKKQIRINEQEDMMTVNRTEICDETHDMIVKGQVEIPRRCPEVEVYAEEMCNIAKVLEENEFTGSRAYKYKSLGADHYRHATNYFKLACKDGMVLYQPEVVDVSSDYDIAVNDWSPI